MSYHLKVLRDYPIAFYPLDETSGTVLYDISGSANNGTSGFNYDLDYLPFVPGGKNAKLVGYGWPPDYKTFTITPTKNYTGTDTSDSFFGTYATSDNDFSIEFWIKPNLTTSLYSSTHRIISDNVGGNLFTNRFEIVFYKNQIIFSVQGNDYNSGDPYGYYEVSANLSFSKKAMHVVAVYATDSISLYIDGVLANTTVLQKDFKFLGQNIPGVEVKTLRVGTYSSLLFGIDALAIYRYALEPSQVLAHYFAGVKQTEPIQIAAPDNGRLFTLNSTKLFETMTYSYPANKSLQSLLGQSVEPITEHSFTYVLNNKDNAATAGDYIYYDQPSKSLKFIDTSGGDTVAFDDFILLPPEIGTTSKIEWRSDFEIRIFTSIDGVDYLECENNSVIPQYKNGSYDTSGKLYLRIYFTSINSNSSFSFLGISFYNTKRFYSDNSGDYIEPTTNSDYTLGALNYPALSHHENNGLRIYDPPSASSGGFTINSTKSISTIEFMYTPKQITGYATCLISKTGTTNVQLSWDSSGILTKTGISKIYINGVDKTSSTNVSELFKEISTATNQTINYLCHVVITFTQISGPLYVNQKSDGTLPGYASLFNNIIIYEDELSGQKVLEHFNLIISKPAAVVVDPAITMSENAVNYYNNDWVPVITTQSVT